MRFAEVGAFPNVPSPIVFPAYKDEVKTEFGFEDCSLLRLMPLAVDSQSSENCFKTRWKRQAVPLPLLRCNFADSAETKRKRPESKQLCRSSFYQS